MRRRDVLKAGAVMGAIVPVARPDQRYDPPVPAQASGGRAGILRANKVIIIGSNGQLLMYSPTVATGDLIVSGAPVAGTDGVPGNPVEQGLAVYGSADSSAVVMTRTPGLVFKKTVTSPLDTGVGSLSYSGTSNTLELSPGGSIGLLVTGGTDAQSFMIVPPHSGTDDGAAINAAFAITKWVILTCGTYNIITPIVMDSDEMILEGQGTSATTLARPSSIGAATIGTVIVGKTKTVSQSGVKNLGINNSAGTGSPITNSGHGVAMAVNQGVLENVLVQYAELDGFHIGQDQVAFASGTTTIAAASDGHNLNQATIDVAATAGLTATGTVIIETSNGPAYITYTGTAGGNQLTGCTSSFDAVATLHTGQKVSQVTGLFDLVASNCYAQFCGNNGWYVDWTYGSCEFFGCKANAGATSSKPTSSGTVNGWLLYGTQLKLIACHAFFASQYGLKLGGQNQFNQANIQVIGGEWESNVLAGLFVENNQGSIDVNGANFYGNGLGSDNTKGQDVFLSAFAINVRLRGCSFEKTSLSNILKQIYSFSSSYVEVTDCLFAYGSIAQNIFLDGPTGAVSHWQVRNNRFVNTTATSNAVLMKGAVTFCEIDGNVCDASFTEQTSGVTPNNNRVYLNQLVAGSSPTITLLGTSSLEWDNQGFAASNSIGGQHLYSSDLGATLTPTVVHGTQTIGAAMALASTDIAGQVSATEALAPGAGTVAAVTFNQAFTNTPVVIVQAASLNASAIGPYVSAASNTGFTISQTAGNAGVVCLINYIVVGQDG